MPLKCPGPARLFGPVFAPLRVWAAGACLAGMALAQAQTLNTAPAPAQRQLTVGLTRMPTSAEATHSVQGLIVRLKEAAPHITTVPGLKPLGDRMRQRDAERWRSVLRGAALTATSGAREPVLRPSGRDYEVLDFGRSLSVAEAERVADRLRQRPEVEWVSLNALEQRLQVTSDPLSAEQWWLKAAGGTDGNVLPDRLRGVPGFFSAWTLAGAGAAASGGISAVVAVLDTGITPHPDLVGRVLPGYDFVSDPLTANDGDGRDSDPTDAGDWVSATDRKQARFANCNEQRSSWHGTVIAGLVAANADNGIGVAGIDRQARILPVRVAGKCGAAVADIVDGMRWAAGLPVAGVALNPNPARIINISFGGSAACGREYQAAVDELRGIGVVVVAAAGNDHGNVSRPANCNGVIGVAALNRDGFKAHYSSFGPALSSTGLATVGGDDARSGAWAELLSDGGLVTVWNTGATGPGSGEYAKLFGTSFAAPLVSGTLSLMLGVNPALTVEQLIEGVRKSARPHVMSTQIGVCSEDNPGRCICTEATCGAGVLDAVQALHFAGNPGSYVPPARQAQVLDAAEIRQAVALGQDLPPNHTATASAAGLSGADGGANSAAGSTGATQGVEGGGGGLAGWQASAWLLLATLLLWRQQRGVQPGLRRISASHS